jgi:hypothetical protein
MVDEHATHPSDPNRKISPSGAGIKIEQFSWNKFRLSGALALSIFINQVDSEAFIAFSAGPLLYVL